MLEWKSHPSDEVVGSSYSGLLEVSTFPFSIIFLLFKPMF